jgi:FMN phosphatase YigB (HAD superfamily)
MAVQKAGAGVIPADCIYVDNRSDYVEAAKVFGMKSIVYSSHPQFVFWLRRYGLYVPQLRNGPESVEAHFQF